MVFAIVAGIALFANAVVTQNNSESSGAVDYIRLFIVDVTFWGPMALLAIWYISIPLILSVGLVAASLRRK